MSKQIIEAINTSSTYQFEGDTAELRLYPTQSFLSSTGQMVGQGSPWNIESWYLPVTCDVQPTGVLYVPSFEIDSTTDGQPRTSKYIAALFDEGGAYVGPFPLMNPNGFAIPPPELMPTPTWGQLQIYNRLPTLLYPPQTFPTRDEMYAAIAAALGLQGPKASETVVGITALSEDPTDPQFPIALSVTDPNWLAVLDILAHGEGFYFLSSYASLALAVTAIGSTRATLLIDSVAAVAGNLTIPSNITLFFTNAGGIQPANGVTVIIRGPITAPPMKIFYNATAGLGTISFSNNTTLGDIYPQWWGAIGDDSTDCAPAFQAMLQLNWYNGSLTGARFRIPTGIYRIGTTLTYRGNFSTSFLMEGETTGEAANGDGPTLKYTGSAGGTMIQMLGANWCTLRDLQFNGNGLALRDVVLDYDASRAQGSFDCHVDHCNFGGVVGVNSTCLVLGTSNFASAEHLVTNSRFIYITAPGTSHYGVANFGTANAKNYTIRDCEFIGFKWGTYLGNSGYHNIEGCSFAGQTEGDIKPAGAQTAVIGCASEGSLRFVDGSALGSTVAGTLTIQGTYFAGLGDASGYVVIYPGKLTLIGNHFGAGVVLGADPPKFKINPFLSTGGGFISQNNIYVWDSATSANFLPFYDTSDRLIGTLAFGTADTQLTSSCDGWDVAGTPLGVPAWDIQGNIGVLPKVILAAFWGSANTYSVAYGDSIILTECAAGPFGAGYNLIALSTPATAKGKKIVIVKTDSSAFAIAIANAFTANINGTKLDRILLTHQYDFVELQSDGASWRIIRYQIGELSGQLTVGGGGTITYTWKNVWATAPVVVTSDTNAAPAASGASSTTTTLTATGTAGHVLSYIATCKDLG